ncbi:MAG: hypothetical protein HY551_00215 [Elusimicrobia bacterium]|nr:hypothetical protein [Elusimicrobiota bacterium]
MKLCNVLVLWVSLFGIFASRAHAGDGYSNANETVNQVGISGNAAVLEQGDASKTAAALGVRARFIGRGDGTDWSNTSGNTVGRASIEYLGAVRKNSELRRSFQAFQGRLGIGVFDFERQDGEKSALDRLYYMVFTDLNYDAAKRNQDKQKALVWTTGGELGRHFKIGKAGALFLGANSGLALLKATNGFESVLQANGAGSDGNTVGTQLRNHNFNRAALSLGVSVDGRIGEVQKRGAIHIYGEGQRLVGAGGRGSGSVDVNISKHIQVGGGLRYMSFADDPNRKGIRDVAPFVRVTLGVR